MNRSYLENLGIKIEDTPWGGIKMMTGKSNGS